MSDDYEYHRNKRPDKTYISKSLSFGSQTDRMVRIASKVIDSQETHSFVKEHGEHVIRVTPGGRQEIIAKFYEDTRGIFVLTVQRFDAETGSPHQTHFSFVGDEIERLLKFIASLRLIRFPNRESINVTDSQLSKMMLSPEQVRNLINHNQELVLELAKSEISKEDIIALGYRRKQLDKFTKLLNDPDYFSREMRELNLSEEGLWQAFFEKNTWVFGYGLSYLFLTSLDDQKLEQVVQGYDLLNKGKRADAVMKTKGVISALCFVEIKKHTTMLLQNRPYRGGCWAPSDELAGAVAQVQGTVSLAMKNLSVKLDFSNIEGDPTGETVFNYNPRSFLLVGNLDEFVVEAGVNQEKYRSFELFRRNMVYPEIVTFDELYHRAKYIVDHIPS